MQRTVTAELDLDVAASVDLVLQITAARTVPISSEQLTLTRGDAEYRAVELVDAAGSRLHRLRAEPGPLTVRYTAIIDGAGPPSPVSELDTITYLRPSRYCPSDELFGQARRQFAGLDGPELLRAVTSFVATAVTYTPGASLGTDSAVATLRSGQGVCRDFAHVVIALLRAMDVPARYAACYAPGLEPMDFHAVAEAYVAGAWRVVDATQLSNRRTLVRIATGRDAADCAFLSYHGGNVVLERLHVDARLSPGAGSPVDDRTALVALV